MLQAEELKRKDDALAEKTAYVGKLEWRLLCQHKALEEKRGKALPAAGKPPPRKPQLTGVIPCSTQGLMTPGRVMGRHCRILSRGRTERKRWQAP